MGEDDNISYFFGALVLYYNMMGCMQLPPSNNDERYTPWYPCA